MSHPFVWLSSSYRWPLFAALLVGTVLFAIKLTSQGKPLRTSVAPEGILSYEFAWTKPEADSILTSWASIKETARQQLLLDFGFLVFYPLALALACAMLSGSSVNKMAAVGVFISWAVLLAGVCAGVKFALVYSSLGYMVLQGLATLAAKMRTA